MKSYYYVVKNGDDKVAAWGGDSTANQPVISTPSFAKRLSGGLSDLPIVLPLPIGYKANDVQLMNTVETFVQKSDGSERLIHAGTIETIERNYTAEGETITVGVMPWIKQMAQDYIRDGTDQTDPISKEWTSAAAGEIMQDLIDLHRSNSGIFGKVHYNATSMPSTQESNIDIEIGAQTYLDAIDDVALIGPQDYYWYVNVSGLFYYRPFKFGTLHRLMLDRDIVSMVDSESIVDMANTAYFWNANDADGTKVALERPDIANTSQTTYGRRVTLITDSRIDDEDTAKRIADTAVENFKNPINEIEITVIDNDFDIARGYPIEDFEPGDRVVIANSERHGNTEYVIIQVDYTPETAVLKLSDKPLPNFKTLGSELAKLKKADANDRHAYLVNLATG